MRHSVNWPLLAAIRFALALTVAFWHLSMVDSDQPLARLASIIGGFGAVGAFLIISGFSIAHSIQKEVQTFYSRRIDRIYPVYLSCFVLSFLPFVLASTENKYGATILSNPPTLQDLIASALVLPAILGKPLATFGASWSLGVEVVFYAAAPFLAKLSARHFTWLLSAVALYYLVQSSGWPVGGAPHELFGIWPILSCAVWWLLGWYLAHQDKEKLTFGLCFLLVSIPCLYALNPQHSQAVAPMIKGDAGPFVMTLVSAACLFGHHVKMNERVKRIALYLGDLSYPLYLIHFPVYWVLAVSRITSPFSVWLYPMAAVLGAAIVLHGIDYPYRKLSRRRAARQGAVTSSLPVTPR